MLLPSYKTVHPATAFCINALFDKNTMKMFTSYGDAFIAHARNELARKFLASECEWSIWIDDDMIVPFGDAAWFNRVSGFGFADKFAGMNAVERLLSHKKTLVGGLYYGRNRFGKPMFAEACGSAVEAAACRRGPQDVIKICKWVATGCLLINRSVFEDISKKYPHLDGNWFSSSEHDVVKSVGGALQILAENIDPQTRIDRAISILGHGRDLSAKYSRVGVGEDVQFCHRALEVGHTPHVDLGLVCGHIGACAYGPYNTYAE